jgi:hypothetical protein
MSHGTKEKTKSPGGDPDDRMIDALRTSFLDRLDDSSLQKMQRMHWAAIRLAVDCRGDAFGRRDTLALVAPVGAPRLQIPCERMPVVVGRLGRDKADYPIEGRGISGRHFVLERESAFVRIRDLHSKNGTYLNGVRIESEYLRHGDRITLGVVELVVQRA